MKIQIRKRLWLIQITLIIIFLLVISAIFIEKTGYYKKPCPNETRSYADAVAMAQPAVVSITTSKKVPLTDNPFFRQFFGTTPKEKNDLFETEQDLGSGVIVDKRGYILTNYHLIKDVDTVLITLSDGRKEEGKIIGTDPDTDLAVVKIDLKDLPLITMGSSKNLRAGDLVFAIGNAFGFEKTVTHGIISATERSGAALGLLENLLQTDAAINPGNSGGALIDSYGRLIGINTAIYSESGGSQGIGFAIPIDQATDVMHQLIDGVRIRRGFLGVTLLTLTPEIREKNQYKEEYGVYVRGTVHESPAEKAGLKAGDIITKINNQIVKDDRHALQIIANLSPDQSYTFEIFRNGQYSTYQVKLGERKVKI